MRNRRLVSQLQAGADDTRIRILELTARGAPTATEVNLHLAMSQPRVAHHLKILVLSGLLNSQRDGRFMRYTLPTSGFEAMLVRLILGEAVPAVEPAGGESPRKARGPVLPASATTRVSPVVTVAPEPEPPDEEPETGGSSQLEDFLL